MKRIALGIQYDGAAWNGWQTQPDGNTVQDVLEAALARFSTSPVRTVCAGRTDAGVHALEQVVHFDTEVEREPFSWVRGANAFLPPSVAVRWAHDLGDASDRGDPAFHARFSARARTYHYVIYNYPVRSPLLVGRAGWVFQPLDPEAMHRAAQHLIGEHDFSAFRAVECQARTPVRRMHGISVQRHGDIVSFTLTANAFLHHMVRNIVGALVYIGKGRQSEAWMGDLLRGRNRSVAAPTFMADGLYLAKIDYDPSWGLPQGQGAIALPGIFP